jgi:hypothetical protein
MFESGEHISVRVSFRWQANSRRCALLTQRRKQRASNQHGPFGSLAATQATKQNANAGFGPFDATQARQRLRPGSPKKCAGYQSRPKSVASPHQLTRTIVGGLSFSFPAPMVSIDRPQGQTAVVVPSESNLRSRAPRIQPLTPPRPRGPTTDAAPPGSNLHRRPGVKLPPPLLGSNSRRPGYNHHSLPEGPPSATPGTPPQREPPPGLIAVNSFWRPLSIVEVGDIDIAVEQLQGEGDTDNGPGAIERRRRRSIRPGWPPSVRPQR